jgi:hypothetical protein
MNKDLLIITHLGLGDLIITHGAIRKLIKEKNPTRTFVLIKEKYLNTVGQMFSDLKNFYLITTKAEWLSYVGDIIPKDFDGEILSCWWYNYHPESIWTEDAMYLSLGFDIEDRYIYFFIPRNYEREEEVYNEVVGTDNNYIFLDEDIERNYIINRELISQSYDRIITMNELRQYSLCDIITILEKANCCHTIHSAPAMLIDALNLSDKLFLHETYIRKLGNECINSLFLNYLKRRNIKLL